MDQSVKEVLHLIQPVLQFVSIQSVVPVGGGCISKAFKITTGNGNFFLKTLFNPPKGMFQAEAMGLQYLRGSGADLVIPGVYAFGESASGKYGYIAMEYLSKARHGTRTDPQEALGRGLAYLHLKKGKNYGFPITTFCGLTPQLNSWSENWANFYRDCRIQPILSYCYQRHSGFAQYQAIFDRLLQKIGEILVAEGPSLVHGDLWQGNYYESDRGAALIDPACSYSEREFEFGMATLFGGFSPTFWEAYQEVYPFQTGWKDRLPLYQLYHYLNHFYLFGGSYGEAALRIAQRHTS